MSGWTKGPYSFEQCMRLDGTPVQEWTIEAPNRGEDDEPTIIAGVFTSKRDAALLTAAPDLAEALEELVGTIGGPLMDKARAALLRAKGE